MQAIILAAGRGSRLGGITDDRPKGLVEVGGRPLIEWQITALNAAGIDNIVVVTGYRADRFKQLSKDIATIHNPDWRESNIVWSLMQTRPLILGPTIVSYSDIVYGSSAVKRLLASKGSTVIAYDEEWQSLWSRRFTNPLSDAESFRIDLHGNVLEIGGHAKDTRSVEGQYMGLLRITPKTILEMLNVSSDKILMKLDMTSLLNRMIQFGCEIKGTAIHGGWCEVDSAGDLAIADEMIRSGKIKI